MEKFGNWLLYTWSGGYWVGVVAGTIGGALAMILLLT